MDIHLFSIDMLIGSGGSVNPDAERQTFFSLFRTRQQNKRENDEKSPTVCDRLTVSKRFLGASNKQLGHKNVHSMHPCVSAINNISSTTTTTTATTMKSMPWHRDAPIGPRDAIHLNQLNDQIYRLIFPKKFHSFHQQVDSLFN